MSPFQNRMKLKLSEEERERARSKAEKRKEKEDDIFGTKLVFTGDKRGNL